MHGPWDSGKTLTPDEQQRWTETIRKYNQESGRIVIECFYWSVLWLISYGIFENDILFENASVRIVSMTRVFLPLFVFIAELVLNKISNMSLI